MLISISDKLDSLKALDKIYSSFGIFSYFASSENYDNFVDNNTNLIDFAIIGEDISEENAIKICRYIKSKNPSVKIAILIKKLLYDRAHFPHLKEADFYIPFPFSDEEALPFFKLIFKNRNTHFDEKILKITPDRKESLLLGYKLSLTKNEHKILNLLSKYPQKSFSQDEILFLAFPFDERFSKNQIAVHICNVNKKARMISGRKLILNPHKKGYIINSQL